ncbi:hypothetical protein MCOR25_001520 [Pyricularia grisea]|uniref:Uncharacterized protein n=1 Tax=Pyricularia grisea TaxID=148305 RepID=A0A6P8ANQ2_PYRGI|nr:uncharacterized protein PgNI_11878 [Pyricularia grisea]KAI6380851.1 hypothetical protein MCOR25_001520 [Pyricularia grisea]TLD03663.1 hypothetical protein PgNI_11878 [Pyricularia grisea]
MAQIRRFLALYASLLASVVAGPLEQRQEPASTSFVLEVTTITAAPATVTKNPLDSTRWVEYPGATWTEYPFTTSSTRTSGCVTYSTFYPSGREVVTITNTIIVTVRSTVTETDTNVPATTALSFTQRTVTAATGTTRWSTLCTNTLVESFYVSSTRTTVVWPSATAFEAATSTEVCVKTSTVSSWADGPMPTTEPYTPAIERFTGKETVISVKQATTADATSVVPDATSTRWSVVCNNPTTVVQQTWYTATVTPTVTVDCNGDVGAEMGLLRRMETGRVVVRDAGEDLQRVETRTYQTIGLREGNVVTSMVTEVVDYLVATFTTVQMIVVTETASAVTVTRC